MNTKLQPLVVLAVVVAVSVLCALGRLDGEATIALLGALGGHGLAKVTV